MARTDHKALVFMNKTSKPISSQFQTWITNLAEFDFDLQFRQGNLHGNADGLSRIGENLCAQCLTTHHDAKSEKSRVRRINILESSIYDKGSIIEMQNNDQITKEIIEYIKDKSSQVSRNLNKSKYYKDINKFIMEEDILLFMDKNTKRIVLAGKSIVDLINYIHEELCHLGTKKLTEYIQTTYFWPDMYRTIEHEFKKIFDL